MVGVDCCNRAGGEQEFRGDRRDKLGASAGDAAGPSAATPAAGQADFPGDEGSEHDDGGSSSSSSSSSSAEPAPRRRRTEPTTLVLHNLPWGAPETSKGPLQGIRTSACDTRGRTETWGDLTLARNREQTTLAFVSLAAARRAAFTLRARHHVRGALTP